MKKSVIFFVVLFYVVAVAVVAFYGFQSIGSNVVKYVENIEIIDPNNQINSTKMKGVDYGFLTVYEEDLVVTLKAKVTPADAKYKDVNFYSDTQDESEFKVIPLEDNLVRIEFYCPCLATLTAESTDGNKLQKSIGIMVLNN